MSDCAAVANAFATFSAIVAGRPATTHREGRRIIVVPVVTPYGGTEAAIEEQLQGLASEVANSIALPDERLVPLIMWRADGE